MSGLSAATVLGESFTRSIAAITAPTVPPGDTLAHSLRVAARRLRSNLRTFEPLVEPRWATEVRTDLQSLAAVLGPIRDAEVLLARLDAYQVPGVTEIARHLRHTRDQAEAAAATHLASPDHAALLTTLQAPVPFLRVADFSAAAILPALLAKPWRRLTRRARAIHPDDPTERWHSLRIHTKRARYALEATALSPALVKALIGCQDILGEHQDAVVAAAAWRAIAPDPALAEVLCEIEATAARQAREAYPRAWKRCDRRKLTAWLNPPG